MGSLFFCAELMKNDPYRFLIYGLSLLGLLSKKNSSFRKSFKYYSTGKSK